MKPGRELDALVAEKVMGLEVIEPSREYYKHPQMVTDEVPEYSTDIAATWKVVEKLDLFSKYYLRRIPEGQWAGQNGNYKIQSYESDSCGSIGEMSHFTFAEGKTAPHAICLAALRIVESK